MVGKLRRAMPDRYGLQEFYRVNRVRFTCRELGIRPEGWEAAEASFSSEEQFCEALVSAGRGTKEAARLRYRQLRDEVARANGGDYRFLPKGKDLSDRWENSELSPQDNV